MKTFQISKLRGRFARHTRSPAQRRTLALALAAICLCAPELAMAQPWDSAAQKVLDLLNGGLTRTVAIIAVVACGIAALAGKLAWDWTIKIVVGVVLIFGSSTIIDYVIGAAG